MLDPHALRENIDQVAKQLQRRGFKIDVEKYIALEAQRKELQVATQALQSERNQRSKEIGIAKANQQDISEMRIAVQQIGEALEEKKQALDAVLVEIERFSLGLPNIPHESVPEGLSAEQNRVIRQWGDIRSFDFLPKSHDELGVQLGQMDFALAAKITGARFVVMKKDLARLQRALIQFMLETHVTQHAYQEVYVPYIVNADSLIGTGQLPKFEEDLFRLSGDNAYYLTSTAEIPVTNMVRNTILEKEQLPLKFVCHSPCFRSEAGSYGKDTKGIIRQHQFEKVELVWISTPDASYEALETLTHHAETILQKLGLPYQTVALCTGDLGASAAKTYDIEVWLPSQNTYREISSCSNMEDFQARRMQARYRDTSQGETRLIHTLNGSGLAVGRTLVAIMENYQDEQGGIVIPDVLQPYMHGLTYIGC